MLPKEEQGSNSLSPFMFCDYLWMIWSWDSITVFLLGNHGEASICFGSLFTVSLWNTQMPSIWGYRSFSSMYKFPSTLASDVVVRTTLLSRMFSHKESIHPLGNNLFKMQLQVSSFLHAWLHPGRVLRYLGATAVFLVTSGMVSWSPAFSFLDVSPDATALSLNGTWLGGDLFPVLVLCSSVHRRASTIRACSSSSLETLISCCLAWACI